MSRCPYHSPYFDRDCEDCKVNQLMPSQTNPVKPNPLEFTYEDFTPRARRSDPVTSHLALPTVKAYSDHVKQVLDTYHQHDHGQGLAEFEVTNILGVSDQRQNWSNMFKPLERDGYLERRYSQDGKLIKQKNPVTGKWAMVRFLK